MSEPMNSIDFHVYPWTKSFMLKNGLIVKACEFFKLDKDRLPFSIDDLLIEMESADVGSAVILGQDAHSTRTRISETIR